jgi:hypothetical protein
MGREIESRQVKKPAEVKGFDDGCRAGRPDEFVEKPPNMQPIPVFSKLMQN